MKSKKLLLKESYRSKMFFMKSHLFFKTKKNKLQDKIQGIKMVADRHTHILSQQREKHTAAFFLFVDEAAPPEDI